MTTSTTAAIRLLALAAFLAIVPATQAQTTPAAPAPAAPSAMHAKVKRLLELTGASKLGLQMVDGLLHNFKEGLPGVPDDFWTAFRAKIKADDMVEMIIPVYEKHLTEADLDGLIAFYSSPLGRRFVEKQPLIMADTMKLGEAWGAKLADQVISDLHAKGYEMKDKQ